MLTVFFTALFWPLVSYPFHRKFRYSFYLSALITALLVLRNDWMSNHLGYAQPDTIGTLHALFSLDMLLKQFSFAEILGGWNPYAMGGAPFFPRYHTLFYALYWLNRLDPFSIPLVAVHNLMSVNYAVVYAIGIFILALHFTKSRAAAFFVFASVLFGTLTIVSEWQEAARWLCGQPYVLWFAIEGWRRRSLRLWAVALGILGWMTTMYLTHGTMIILAALAAVGFSYGRDEFLLSLKARLWNRQGLVFLLGVFALLLALGAPAIYSAVAVRGQTDSGRFYVDVFNENKSFVSEEAISGHVARWSDLPKMVLDRHTSYGQFMWRFGGPFGVSLAFLGLFVFGFRRREKVPIALGVSALVLIYFAIGSTPWLWRLPLVGLLRHRFFLLGDASFCLALLAAYGMKALGHSEGRKAYAAILVVPILTGAFFPEFGSAHPKLFIALQVLALTLMVAPQVKRKGRIFIALAFISTVSTTLYEHRSFAKTMLARRAELPSSGFPAFRYPETRTCVAQFPYDGDLQRGAACLTKSIPLLAGFSPSRLSDLLGVAYPERLIPENFRKNLDAYRREYRLLGNAGMPIFFFTDGAQLLTGETSDTLKKMLREYEKRPPLEVFFLREDVGQTVEPKPASYHFPLRAPEHTGLRRIEIAVDAPEDGYLVRSENFSRLWSVQVDGAPSEILKANYAFQAVRVKRGRQSVVFSFSTAYPYWFWLHQLGLFFLVVLAVDFRAVSVLTCLVVRVNPNRLILPLISRS